MRGRLCCLALAILLVPVVSLAQEGLRSASLPRRDLIAPREDVFLAGPNTYRPDPNRIPVPVFGFLGPSLVYPAVPPIVVVQIPRDVMEPARTPAAAPAPAPAPYVAGMPGRPKTFYVIPGCYAGDRRPEPGSLARGCSLSRLRVVPPSL